MKLKDALQMEGKKIKIPETYRQDLPPFFKEMGFKKGAEIGIYKGWFTEKFCKQGMKMYAIDPWLVYKDYDHPRGQARLDFQYEHTKRALAPYDCTIYREFSMDALKHFEDESLDFVYIDASHLFKYIAEDIYEWSKKVRKGGIVSGHDYTSGGEGFTAIHVKYVVDAYVDCFDIPKLYILDGANNNHPLRGEDKTSSWFFIKE